MPRWTTYLDDLSEYRRDIIGGVAAVTADFLPFTFDWWGVMSDWEPIRLMDFRMNQGNVSMEIKVMLQGWTRVQIIVTG